jgi:hypothetical protein
LAEVQAAVMVIVAACIKQAHLVVLVAALVTVVVPISAQVHLDKVIMAVLIYRGMLLQLVVVARRPLVLMPQEAWQEMVVQVFRHLMVIITQAVVVGAVGLVQPQVMVESVVAEVVMPMQAQLVQAVVLLETLVVLAIGQQTIVYSGQQEPVELIQVVAGVVQTRLDIPTTEA